MRPYSEGLGRIRITCPGCRKRGSVASRLVGREVRCRRCQECFDVPVSGASLGVTWPLEGGEVRVVASPLALGVAGHEPWPPSAGPLRLFVEGA